MILLLVWIVVINEHRLTRSKRMSSYSHSPSPLVWKTRKQHNVRWWGWALLDHSGRERFKSYASHLTTLAKFVIQKAHASPWQDPSLTWITTCSCPLFVRQGAKQPPHPTPTHLSPAPFHPFMCSLFGGWLSHGLRTVFGWRHAQTYSAMFQCCDPG